MGASESCAKFILENNERKALEQIDKIMSNDNQHNLYQYVSKCKSPLLLAACKANMVSVCAKMMAYPTHCNMRFTDENGNTAFMYACRNRMVSIAESMLAYPHLCKLEQVNDVGSTALNYVDFVNMEKLAIKILDSDKQCGLNHINLYGNTPLMTACISKSDNIAMKILSKRKSYSLYTVNVNNQSAFDIAVFNDMKNVAFKILESYSSKAKTLLIDKYSSNKSLINIYSHLPDSRNEWDSDDEDNGMNNDTHSKDTDQNDKHGDEYDDDKYFHNEKNDCENNNRNSSKVNSAAIENKHKDQHETRSEIDYSKTEPYLKTYAKKACTGWYPPIKNAKQYKDKKRDHTGIINDKEYFSPDKVEHYYLGKIKVCILG